MLKSLGLLTLRVGRGCGNGLSGALLLAAPPALTAAAVPNSFLQGYLAAILEQELHWPPASYGLRVVGGNAVITLASEDPQRRAAAANRLGRVAGLSSLTWQIGAVTGAPAQEPAITGSAFNTGDLFLPLIADPKQPQFSAAVTRFQSKGQDFKMASVAFGETLGLYRFHRDRDGDGLQVSLEAALLAQFNLSTPSSNLINADYLVGIPGTFRHGADSYRWRLYHQSSHLGDEELLGPNPPQRVNLSFEAFELLYGHEWGGLRAYAGGEVLLHREPRDLKRLTAHWGLDYRGKGRMFFNTRPIAGLDLNSAEEHRWAISASAKAGVEFGQPTPGQRRLRLLLEWYDGYNPRGQFYQEKMHALGLGLSLGF